MRQLVAYTDGTYDESSGNGAWAAILIYNGAVVNKISGIVPPEKSFGSRQIASEFAGTENAVRWAIENRYDSILIRHDLMMIKWIDLPSEDSSKYSKLKPISICYRRVMSSLLQWIDIEFMHVKGHSGDVYNDMADELAKDTLRKKLGLRTHADHVARKRAKAKYRKV